MGSGRIRVRLDHRVGGARKVAVVGRDGRAIEANIAAMMAADPSGSSVISESHRRGDHLINKADIRRMVDERLKDELGADLAATVHYDPLKVGRALIQIM